MVERIQENNHCVLPVDGALALKINLPHKCKILYSNAAVKKSTYSNVSETQYILSLKTMEKPQLWHSSSSTHTHTHIPSTSLDGLSKAFSAGRCGAQGCQAGVVSFSVPHVCIHQFHFPHSSPGCSLDMTLPGRELRGVELLERRKKDTDLTKSQNERVSARP